MVDESRFKDAPEAIVKMKKQFSIVWVVPLVALLIGGWLAFKAISEKGPTITITFKTAEGLEAGKTKIKYKDVEVGQVESISLNEDGSRVIVTAQMAKGAKGNLTENTRFWVERARIGAAGAAGLGTLFAGAYIGIDLGKPGGKPTLSFEGLEVPPVVTTGLPGHHFKLKAEELRKLYRDFYKNEPFVRVAISPPHTKHTWGTNLCLVYPTVDQRTGKLIVISAIDNLIKGASGQAIQNMNLMLGLPETTGLEALSVFP